MPILIEVETELRRPIHLEIMLFREEHLDRLFSPGLSGELELSRELQDFSIRYYFPEGLIGYHVFDQRKGGFMCASSAHFDGTGSVFYGAESLLQTTPRLRLLYRFAASSRSYPDRDIGDILTSPLQYRGDFNFWDLSDSDYFEEMKDCSSQEELSPNYLLGLAAQISGATFSLRGNRGLSKVRL